MDSMNLWIDIARDDLVKIVERVDCLVLNDAEIRQLTGRPSVVRAARELLSWGPSAIVAKQGEYGAALVTQEGFFALPAYPLERVIDPTGAGDTFAGGLVGYVAAHPGDPVSGDRLRDRAGLLQRRGVRDRAGGSPQRGRGRRARRRPRAHDELQRSSAGSSLVASAVAPLSESLNSRMPRPSDRPASGSFLGPRMIRATASTRMISIGPTFIMRR
jgi:hypothetical protein